MGRKDGANAAPTVMRHPEDKRQRTPDHDEEHGILVGPIEHGRQHRAPDGEHERDCEHGHVRPRGKSRARAGQRVTNARVTGDGDPAGRSAASAKLCIVISPTAAPDAAPRIPYWTSRDPVAPAIAPTTTESRRPKPRRSPPLGQSAPRVRCRWRPVPSPDRSRGPLPTAPPGGLLPGREEPAGKPAPAWRQR